VAFGTDLNSNLFLFKANWPFLRESWYVRDTWVQIVIFTK